MGTKPNGPLGINHRAARISEKRHSRSYDSAPPVPHRNKPHTRNPQTHKPPMKQLAKLSAFTVTLCIITATLIGCGTFGANPSPLTPLESSLFTTKTNDTELPTGQRVRSFVHTPNAETLGMIETAGAVTNVFAPGIGTLLAGMSAGVLAAWARMRSAKNAAPVLAQNIETMREFVKTLPDGQRYDRVLTEWMARHQANAGSTQAVMKLLREDVSNKEALGTVAELEESLAALK